jgi:RNA polymerase sigma factor (TIGR02999 family)
MKTREDITALLRAWSCGEGQALDELIPLVYEDLRRIARSQFSREPPEHTLEPTALVSEVYLRLSGQRSVVFENRGQFFAFAAMLMRRILVDHAKGRKASKRGSGLSELPLSAAYEVPIAGGVDVLALDDALSRLSNIDERMGRIVELRFFVGLTSEEIAELLGVSLTSVKRDWKTAKMWLYHELT